MKINIPYTKQFLALCSILAVLIFALKTYLGITWVNDYVWYIYIYLVVIMYASHFLLSYGFSQTPLDAQNFFMLSTTIKIIFSGIIIFIYFYSVKDQAKTFLLNFFILYFVFTFFEIRTLLLSLQPHSKSDSNK